MEIGSACSGNCEDCVTGFTGGCLAGHGDDHFLQITIKHAREILSDPRVEDYTKKKVLSYFPELMSKEEKKELEERKAEIQDMINQWKVIFIVFNRELFAECAIKLQDEYKVGGFAGTLYEDFAWDVMNKYITRYGAVLEGLNERILKNGHK